MLVDLTGKTAVVTGSTSASGRRPVRELRASGATVVINGRTDERVQAAVDRPGTGDRIIGVAADVGTATGCQALLAAVSHVDILVSNAGIATLQSVFEIADAK